MKIGFGNFRDVGLYAGIIILIYTVGYGAGWFVGKGL